MPVNSVRPPSAAPSVRGSSGSASSGSPAGPATPESIAANAAAHATRSGQSGATQQGDSSRPATAAPGGAAGKRQSTRATATATNSSQATASPATKTTPPTTFGQTLASSLSAVAGTSQSPPAASTATDAPAATPQGQDLTPIGQLKAAGSAAAGRSTVTAGQADKSVAPRATTADDEEDAEADSATALTDATSAATTPTSHSAASIATLAAAPLNADPRVTTAAATQAHATQDDDDSGPAADTAAIHTAAPLPQSLTAVLQRSAGSGPDSQSSDGDTDGGDDPNSSAAALAAASVNGTASAGSTHAQSAVTDAQSVHAQVGTDAWTNELGARVTLMAQQGISSASLRLSPAHLGPLEVHISVRDSSASVWFGATQTDTRAALEQALPRLREMFASQGLNLANAGVSGETPRGTPQNAQAQQSVRVSEAAREVSVTPVTSGVTSHQGLIDTYA